MFIGLILLGEYYVTFLLTKIGRIINRFKQNFYFISTCNRKLYYNIISTVDCLLINTISLTSECTLYLYHIT